MKEAEMKKIAAWINQAIDEVKSEKLPDTKEKRAGFVKDFKARVAKNKKLLFIADEVKALTQHFPIPWNS